MLPPEFESTSWWVHPMLASMKSALEQCARSCLPGRRMTMVSLCTGIGSEIMAARSLGLPVGSTIAAERDSKVRGLLQDLHADHLGHIYTSMSDVAGESGVLAHGECSLHEATCAHRLTDCVDLLIAGPPCQPYSVQRNQSQVPPSEHGAFSTLFGGW